MALGPGDAQLLSDLLCLSVRLSVRPLVCLSVCLSVLCNVSWQLLQATHLCTRCECKGRTSLAHSLLVVTQQITRCSREGRTLACSLNVCRDIMASSCFISHSFLGSCVRAGCVCVGAHEFVQVTFKSFSGINETANTLKLFYQNVLLYSYV